MVIRVSENFTLENLYERIADFSSRMSRDLAADLIKAYRTRPNSDIYWVIYAVMDLIEVHVLDAMVAAHLMGYLRSLVNATNYLQRAKKFGAYDDAISFMQKKLALQPNQISNLKKMYGPYAIQATHGMGNVIEKKVQQAMKTIITKNYHIKNAMAHLSDTLKKAGVKATNPWLLETTVRTQIHTAYSAGRWDASQATEIQDILWGWEYVTAGDFRVRDEHEMLDGVKLPKEDPQWTRIWPPNGFNCRCDVLEIYKDEGRRAVRREIPEPVMKDGKLIVPGPDASWAINHGQVFTTDIVASPGAMEGLQEFMAVTDKFGKTIHVSIRTKYSGPPTPKNVEKWTNYFERMKDQKLKWMNWVDDLIEKGTPINFENSFWSPKTLTYYNWQSKRVSTIGRVAEIIPPKPPPVPVPVPGPPPPAVGDLFNKASTSIDDVTQRLEAHKAALKKRMGFDFKDVNLARMDTPEVKKFLKKFDDALMTFSKRTEKATEARRYFKTHNRFDFSYNKFGKKVTKFDKYGKSFYDVLEKYGSNDAIKFMNNKPIDCNIFAGIRANAGVMRMTINLDKSNNIGVAFHELGHLFEHNKAWRVKAMRWAKNRSNGIQNKLSRISHYKDMEQAWVNKFIDKYVGKFYKDGCTEVTSMGMAQFTNIKSMIRFAKKDFDHFSLIHGLMCGAI